MASLILLPILALATSVVGLPAAGNSTNPNNCTAPVVTQPWYLRDIIIFEPYDNCTLSPSICFHFCDINQGLEVETECRLIPGTDESLTGVSQTCDNNAVSFILDGDSISLAQTFTAPW